MTTARRRHPAGRPGTAPTGPAGVGPARGRRVARSPRDLAAGFVTLFLEVEAGLRPRSHLTPLMCPLLVARMEGRWCRPGPQGRLVRLAGSPPAAGAYEAVAVVRRGERYGAIGLRLVLRQVGWRVEDLARPELGPLPAAPYPVALEEGSGQEDDGAWRSPQGARLSESA
jgi:hypothetical protein